MKEGTVWSPDPADPGMRAGLRAAGLAAATPMERSAWMRGRAMARQDGGETLFGGHGRGVVLYEGIRRTGKGTLELDLSPCGVMEVEAPRVAGMRVAAVLLERGPGGEVQAELHWVEGEEA